jgi:branched-chain amino acid transport system permease protein
MSAEKDVPTFEMGEVPQAASRPVFSRTAPSRSGASGSRSSGPGSVPPTTTTRPLWSCAMNPGPWVIGVVGIFWVFAMPDYLVFTMASAIPVAIVAIGLLILQGWSREISLATAGLFATSMYVTGILDRDNAKGQDWPWPFAALVGIAVAAGLMGLLALFSAKLPGIYVIAFTLVLQVLIERVVYPREYLSGGALGGPGQTITNPRPPWFGSQTSD